MFRGTYDFEEPAFDWGVDYQRPNLAPQDLIVYEMGVRSFTADESSAVGAEQQGTFLGLIEKVGPLQGQGQAACGLVASHSVRTL